jgi:hypothetical protein
MMAFFHLTQDSAPLLLASDFGGFLNVRANRGIVT